MTHIPYKSEFVFFLLATDKIIWIWAEPKLQHDWLDNLI